MGANRSGAAAKKRRRRREKFEKRLALRAEQGDQQTPGMVATVKGAATGAAKAVGKAVKKAATAVKGAVT